MYVRQGNVVEKEIKNKTHTHSQTFQKPEGKLRPHLGKLRPKVYHKNTKRRPTKIDHNNT